MSAEYVQCVFHGDRGDTTVWIQESDIPHVGKRSERIGMIYTLDAGAKVYSGSASKLELVDTSVRVTLSRPKDVFVRIAIKVDPVHSYDYGANLEPDDREPF